MTKRDAGIRKAALDGLEKATKDFSKSAKRASRFQGITPLYCAIDIMQLYAELWALEAQYLAKKRTCKKKV